MGFVGDPLIFQCPDVCLFGVFENVSVAIVRANTKIDRIRAAPLIVDRFDKDRLFADPKLDRTFICLMTGIRFNDYLHSLVPVKGRH